MKFLVYVVLFSEDCMSCSELRKDAEEQHYGQINTIRIFVSFFFCIFSNKAIV